MLVRNGRSAVSLAGKRLMVSCNTGWSGSRHGCRNLNLAGLGSWWMSSRHDCKHKVKIRTSKGNRMLLVRQSQRGSKDELLTISRKIPGMDILNKFYIVNYIN